MYRVLQGVPKAVRQEAYQKFLGGEPLLREDYFDDEERYWRRVDGENYCPLGMVNLLLLGKPPMWTLPVAASELAWEARNADVERFVHDNDQGKFADPARLAAAMGVEVME